MSDPELHAHAQTQLSLVRARERARLRDILRFALPPPKSHSYAHLLADQDPDSVCLPLKQVLQNRYKTKTTAA